MIVSVLMLREGFDVNNICVIVPRVPARHRFCWSKPSARPAPDVADDEYTDLKRENRERINAGQEPGTWIDVLSIVEHPAFQSFYDELLNEGLAGTTGTIPTTPPARAMCWRRSCARALEAFDFGIPFILQEADELHAHDGLDISTLARVHRHECGAVTGLLGKGDTFISQDLQSATLFGDYRVDGAVMNVGGYNEYLSRLTRRISQALSEPMPKGNKIATHLPSRICRSTRRS